MTTEATESINTMEYLLNIEETMHEIKKYLDEPKWTDVFLNEERHLFDSPFKVLIPT